MGSPVREASFPESPYLTAHSTSSCHCEFGTSATGAHGYPNHDWEREHVTSRIVIKGRSRMCSRHHRILEDLSSEDQDGEVQVWSRERFDMVNMPMEEGECESEVE
jgi:hypothetical protein